MDFNNQTSCKNCDEPLTTPFCGHCGQPKAVRITFKELIRTIQMGLLEFRSPFLHTFKMLTIAPGKVCRDYVEGKRERYFNPIKYAFWSITVLVFIATLTNVSLSNLEVIQTDNLNSTESGKQFRSTLQHVLDSSLFFLTFVNAFGFALMFRLFYRKRGFNVCELYILTLLPTAHVSWFIAIIVASGWYATPTGLMIATLISASYSIIALATFLEGKFFSNLWRATLAYMVSFAVVSLVVGTLFGFAVGVKYGFDEAKQQQEHSHHLEHATPTN